METAREITWSLLRIVAGFLFMQHGLQKLFGLLGGMGPQGGSAEPMSGLSGGRQTGSSDGGAASRRSRRNSSPKYQSIR